MKMHPGPGDVNRTPPFPLPLRPGSTYPHRAWQEWERLGLRLRYRVGRAFPLTGVRPGLHFCAREREMGWVYEFALPVYIGQKHDIIHSPAAPSEPKRRPNSTPPPLPKSLSSVAARPRHHHLHFGFALSLEEEEASVQAVRFSGPAAPSGPERTQEEELHQTKCGYERNYIQARAHEGKGLREGRGRASRPPSGHTQPQCRTSYARHGRTASASLSAFLPWLHPLGSLSGCAILMSGGWRAGASCISASARSMVLGEEPGISKLVSPLATMARSRAD
ncbi:hypothetical protein DFH08DRAFT_969739 [Mycena albidolilacea]|uniref:Uncharacterized protein n=1 Tax=Mycena albidolilacea TaxID=1033008 RepID=A0AAD7EG70_9AGAR|nr:hypothetical protein DFH08DRAFT_969739 [Mycena albidolilacea]